MVFALAAGGCERTIEPGQRVAKVEQAASGGWARVASGPIPPARWAHAGDYFLPSRQTIIFGGNTGSVSNDTWGWDGGSWALLCDGGGSCGGPSARQEMSLVYDKALGQLVMFGGNNGLITFLNDTWEFDGQKWKQVCTSLPCSASVPAVRGVYGLAYDPIRNVVVLFGGGYAQGVMIQHRGDTWEFDGGTWVQRCSACGPSAREGPAMAWDGTRVVLMGGYDGTSYLNDTWAFDAGSGVWEQLSPAQSPPPRTSPGSTYDAVRQRMVVYGGGQVTAVPLDDTWEWDGTNWASVTDGGPGARFGMPLAFDAMRGRVVLVSGSDGGLPLGVWPDTWEYAGAAAFPLGTPCTVDSSCLSGFCVDGVCCQSACVGQCESCDATGSCVQTVGAPVAPRPACSGSGVCQGSCQPASNTACTFPGVSTQCAAASCSGGSQHLASGCDGAGGCLPQTNQSCDPYICGASACLTTCSSGAECIPGDVCLGMSCLPDAGTPDGGMDAGSDGGVSDGGADGGGSDAGADGGSDAGADGGMSDAGADGGGSDAGADGGTLDAGPPDDGGIDGGSDGGTDAGEADAGGPDAGGSDAGEPDAGGSDAGEPDAGADAGNDGGTGDGGLGSPVKLGVGCGCGSGAGAPLAALGLLGLALRRRRLRAVAASRNTTSTSAPSGSFSSRTTVLPTTFPRATRMEPRVTRRRLGTALRPSSRPSGTAPHSRQARVGPAQRRS